jgi:hypothetical protein
MFPLKAIALSAITTLDEENGGGEKGDEEAARILLMAYVFILYFSCPILKLVA